MLIENFQQLRQTWALTIDNIGSKQHSKWFIPDKIPGSQNGVAEPQSLSLAYIENVNHLGYFSNPRELAILTFAMEVRLQFDRNIEVILNVMLAATGYKKDLFDT